MMYGRIRWWGLEKAHFNTFKNRFSSNDRLVAAITEDLFKNHIDEASNSFLDASFTEELG